MTPPPKKGATAASLPQEKRIDWADLHRRLAKAQNKLKQGWAPDAATARKILRRRAQNLAVEASGADTAENNVEFLDFTLGEAQFGLETVDIREVTMISGLLPVPGTPPFVAGIINVRSHIVSVLDLKNLFQLPVSDSSYSRVLLIGGEDKMLGILADSIGGVRRTDQKGLQNHLPTLAGYCERYLMGVTPDRTVLLNAKALLSDESIIVHADVEI